MKLVNRYIVHLCDCVTLEETDRIVIIINLLIESIYLKLMQTKRIHDEAVLWIFLLCFFFFSYMFRKVHFQWLQVHRRVEIT